MPGAGSSWLKSMCAWSRCAWDVLDGHTGTFLDEHTESRVVILPIGPRIFIRENKQKCAFFEHLNTMLGSSPVLLTKICPRRILTCSRGSPKKGNNLNHCKFDNRARTRRSRFLCIRVTWGKRQCRYEPPPEFLLTLAKARFNDLIETALANHCTANLGRHAAAERASNGIGRVTYSEFSLTSFRKPSRAHRRVQHYVHNSCKFLYSSGTLASICQQEGR